MLQIGIKPVKLSLLLWPLYHYAITAVNHTSFIVQLKNWHQMGTQFVCSKYFPCFKFKLHARDHFNVSHSLVGQRLSPPTCNCNSSTFTRRKWFILSKLLCERVLCFFVVFCSLVPRTDPFKCSHKERKLSWIQTRPNTAIRVFPLIYLKDLNDVLCQN